MKQASCWRGVPPFRCRHERPAVGLMTGNLELRLRKFERKNNPIRTGGLEEKDNIEERSSSEKEKKPNRAGSSFRSGEEHYRYSTLPSWFNARRWPGLSCLGRGEK